MFAILDKVLDKLPLLLKHTGREVARDLDSLSLKGWRALVRTLRRITSEKLPRRSRRGYRMKWTNRLFVLIWSIEAAYFLLLFTSAIGLLVRTPPTGVHDSFALLAVAAATVLAAAFYRRLAYEERFGR